jgi:N-dimethylarginine dimethylaminohydrolase
MSSPDYFEVFYAINPWMKTDTPVDRELAQAQWQSLKTGLKKRTGAQISLVKPVPGLPDLVFTANAAFVHGDRAILAQFKNLERRPEEAHYRCRLQELGYQVIEPPVAFEGAGDALVYDGRLVLAGYRQRTEISAHQMISQTFDLPVLSLELHTEHFYHVDTCLCPLEGGHLLYYPGAFDEYGLKVIEANVPEEKRLTVTSQEARNFACNAVQIGRFVFLNQPSDRLSEALKRRGFEVVGLDLSEFLKAGGSAKCLTLRLN